MKKVYLILILSSFISTSVAQSKFINPSDMFFEDKHIIDSIKADLNSFKVDTILIYQAWLFRNCFDFDQGFSSFVIWKQLDTVKALRINNEGVSDIVALDNSKIFYYDNFKLAGVTENEDLTYPKINFLGNLCGEFVIYYSSELQFFFELGQTTNYTEDETMVPFRQKWIDIIKNDLLLEWDQFIVEKLLKRKKYPEEY